MKIFIRRISVIFLAVTILLCLLPAFAANSDGTEAAIIDAKSKINIPAELSEFDSYIYTNGDITNYTLSWSKADGSSHINTTINNMGDITEYYSSSERRDDSVKFPVYSAEELKATALAWLEKVNPDWLPELDTDNPYISGENNIYNSHTQISFPRIINGLNFLGDEVSFSLNNRSGEITNMYSSWHYENAVPAPDEAISDAEAGDIFFKLSPLELIYTETNDGKAELVYNPTNPYIRINARYGGELAEKFYDKNSAAGMLSDSAMEESAEGGSSNRVTLTESEIKNLDELNSFLPETELKAIAATLKNTGLDTAKFKDISYNRGSIVYLKNADEEKADYYATLTFAFNPDTENEYSATLTLDAKTGEVIRYFSGSHRFYYNKSEVKPKVDGDTALNSAEEFILQNAPGIAENVKAKPTDASYGAYNFNFVRYENDIPFYSNSISVEVNAETGYICSFYKTWDYEIVFESPEGIIDTKNAEDCFRRNVGFNLSYKYDYKNSAKGEPELCYTAMQNHTYMIDAKTGEIASTPNYDEPVIPVDISGHYAESQISALVSAGVIETDRNDLHYRPDDTITSGELALLTARLTRRYYPISLTEAESVFRDMKILLPTEVYDANAPAVRTDGAVYIIRAIGYREVAEIPNIFTCNFADADKIAPEKAGYAAIAKGLNIVRGDENGCFNPDAALSRADAAIMIYNYLSR